MVLSWFYLLSRFAHSFLLRAIKNLPFPPGPYLRKAVAATAG